MTDEERHAPAADEAWAESWCVEFARSDGTGGAVRLSLWPHRRCAWCWAHVVTPDAGPVVVRHEEVPLPRGGSLEVRADSMWAVLECETPLEHWTIGLEAFGVRLEDPDDAYRGERGDRVAVGLDLEWEAEMPTVDVGDGYEQSGLVHGEVLVGDERLDFEGRGTRTHTWGVLDWWSGPRHRGAFQAGETLAVGVHELGTGASGYVWRLGDGVETVPDVLVESHAGPAGDPVAARYVLGEVEVEMEVVGRAPVLVAATDARRVRLARGSCTGTVGGQPAAGWAEWLHAPDEGRSW